MAWSGAASTSKALEVPAALAACQGLAEGMTVRVHALPGTPLASQVSVEPASADDWEQAELNAEFMEEQLVNQVSLSLILHPAQGLPDTCLPQSMLFPACPLPAELAWSWQVRISRLSSPRCGSPSMVLLAPRRRSQAHLCVLTPALVPMAKRGPPDDRLYILTGSISYCCGCRGCQAVIVRRWGLSARACPSRSGCAGRLC